MNNNTLSLLSLLPEYRDYVWGGQKLRPGKRTAEAWIIHETDQVGPGSPFAGKTLGELSETFGELLLGSITIKKTGQRFPLLVKILESVEWLSIQVHPNDLQAVALEGPGHFGKTEAWVVLEAEVGSSLLAGLKPGVSSEKLRDSIRSGEVAEICQKFPVQPGQAFFIEPGTLHSIGPGLLIYEIQQASDITYRVFDWNRPAAAGRQLHIEKSIEVTKFDSVVKPISAPNLNKNDQITLLDCDYFRLMLLSVKGTSLIQETRGESFHILTVIEGEVKVEYESKTVKLKQFETILVPACCSLYTIISEGSAKILKSKVI